VAAARRADGPAVGDVPSIDRTLGANVLVAGLTRANGHGPIARASIKRRRR